ncbi:sporulation-control protein [Thalassobacillus cyri]|uniref:Sporulation-control protein n=1 Tax=Thalassobacillus cyri TaxID=571932 RepID=A0A1H3ZI84_9BACI|nr:sporulation protein [Thalassobacillus cyri]SEA23469.1 sporulation-control protein [Thalassobacillus cyri]
MITKVLSKLKVGSPKVDLVLNTKELTPGSNISGSFHLYGGWVRQRVNRLECDLVKEQAGKKPEFIEPVTTVLMSKTIEANDKTEIPFHYQLPEELPPTTEGITYRLQTKIVFKDDVKSFDHDEIVVTN